MNSGIRMQKLYNDQHSKDGKRSKEKKLRLIDEVDEDEDEVEVDVEVVINGRD
jgi:hypothetical protein